MKDDLIERLTVNHRLMKQDILKLTSFPEVLLKDADPPRETGVYMFLVDGEIVYVGQAKGSGGLYDRIVSKHISGDKSHTLQRQFFERIPDGDRRRKYIKEAVSVKWVVIEDPFRVSTVERLVIQMLRPLWNRN